jgi:hypothetical protein
LVVLVLLVQQDLKVQQVHLVVLQVQLELLVRRVPQDLLGLQVLMALLVPPVQQGHKVQQALMV